MLDKRVVSTNEEGPPWLGTWPRVYSVVLVYLTALILALYWISRHFTY